MSLETKLKPLGDRLIVKRSEKEEKSAGGILLPDAAKEKPIQGVVVAVGPGKVLDNGDQRAPAIKAKQKVLFGKYAGTEVKIGEEEVLILREDDILAIVED